MYKLSWFHWKSNIGLGTPQISIGMIFLSSQNLNLQTIVNKKDTRRYLLNQWIYSNYSDTLKEFKAARETLCKT